MESGIADKEAWADFEARVRVGAVADPDSRFFSRGQVELFRRVLGAEG